MLLGRRKKEARGAPAGLRLPPGLEDAEPLPFFYDHTWDPSDENLAFVAENEDRYRPCLPRGTQGIKLESPIKVSDIFEYVAVLKMPDGRKYLVDGPTHTLLYHIATNKCSMTVADLSQLMLMKAAETMEEIREVVEKGPEASEEAKKYAETLVALTWRQIAMLRDKKILF